MGVFFIYILKSSVCLVLFYLFFRLLLSKETFHRFNRMALLGVLFFSLLIPCIEVTTRHQVEVQQAVLSIEQLLLMAELETTPANVGAVQETSAISWVQIVLLVYWAGILFLACRNIYSLICLFRLVHSGKHEKLEKGVTLVVHNQEIVPFSWVKYIVISRKDLEENGREILIHEMAHIHHRHSVDLLVADICIFFQWFNPGAWLLKQELQNIHEYEADETVINEGVNAKEYQLLLIKKAVGTRLYSMANSFNHINDLAEIVEKKSEENVVKEPIDTTKNKVVVVGYRTEKKDSVLTSGKKKVAISVQGISGEGKPLVIINGKESEREVVNALNPERIESVSVIGPEKAIKIYGEKAKDGVMDIKLYSEKKFAPRKIEIEGINKTRLDALNSGAKSWGATFRSADGGKPLVIIDGKEATGDDPLANISPDRIRSISVLKDKTALAAYGDKGKNGVIEVNLLVKEEYQARQISIRAINDTVTSTIKVTTSEE